MKEERLLESLQEEKRRLESEIAALRSELNRISKLRIGAHHSQSVPDKTAAASLRWTGKLLEVAHCFSWDPVACLKDRGARSVLRTYEHPYRYWHQPFSKDQWKKVVEQHLRGLGLQHNAAERKKLEARGPEYWMRTVGRKMVDEQQIPFWDALRKKLADLKELPRGLEIRFADYLTGYLLVSELQPPTQQEKSLEVPWPSNSWRKITYPVPRPWPLLWRSFKRSRALKKAGATAAATITTELPHREHLKTRLVVLMAQDLARRRWRGKRPIYRHFVIPAWKLIGIEIRDDESLIRQVRRSRAKARTSWPSLWSVLSSPTTSSSGILTDRK
jgi:hypothetical protein